MFCTRKRGWVSRENAFFEFFLRRLSTRPTPSAPCIPLRWRPQPPAHPDGLHSTDCTGCKANHTRHGTRARTLGTLHRSALDTRQATPGRSGRWRRWSVCNPSIMCIMIALSQAWYIDSRLYKYHTNILLHLVIVNYYLSIDIPPY